MKKSEVVELRSKSVGELKKILEEVKSETGRLMIEVKTRKFKNTASVGQKKKDIARILTLIREKELAKL